MVASLMGKGTGAALSLGWEGAAPVLVRLFHEGEVYWYEGTNSIPKALAKRKNVDI
jgi:hypothetical protein